MAHAFATGQLWRLVTDVLVQGKPGLRWSILIPFIWVGIAEWHLGWRRTAIAFFVTDWVSTVSTLIVLRTVPCAQPLGRPANCNLRHWFVGSDLRHTEDFTLRGPNSWIAPVLLVQTMVTIWLTNHRLFDVQHLISITVGLVLGVAVYRRDPAAVT